MNVLSARAAGSLADARTNPGEARAQRRAQRAQIADGTELPWLCGMAAALGVVCGLPYVLSAAFGPRELERLGTFWFSRDFSQYEAAMREGARQTGWLIHNHFSAEPHHGALIYPFYVAAGKLAAALGLGDLTVFAALEWLGRIAVLGAVYLFAATFFQLTQGRLRRLALLLALGTLGLDACAAVVRLLLNALGASGAAGFFPDAINPYLEVSSFGVLLAAPHLMLGLALTLLCAPVYLRAMDGRRAWLVLLGVTVFSLSLVHAFNTPVLVSVLALHALLTGRRAWPAAIVAALAAAPIAVYSLYVFQADPFWSGTYGSQNTMPAPIPWALPFDFGIVLLAAPLAWRVVRDWAPERRRLILLWVALGLLWMYAPVPYQRRLAFGVQPALAVLAAAGLVELNAWMRARNIGAWKSRLANYTLFIAACSTSLLVYLSLLASTLLNKPAEVYLWSQPEAEAAAWLGEHSTRDDVVLASTEFANPLAGAIDGRVVHGHIVATRRSPEKQALVRDFYAADASPEQRTLLLGVSGATLVALGPRERALGANENLIHQPELDLVYARDGVELFRVRR